MSDPGGPEACEDVHEDLPTTELVVTSCAIDRAVIAIINRCLDEDRFIRLIAEGEDVLKVIKIVDEVKGMRNGGILQQTRTSFPHDRATIEIMLSVHPYDRARQHPAEAESRAKRARTKEASLVPKVRREAGDL